LTGLFTSASANLFCFKHAFVLDGDESAERAGMAQVESTIVHVVLLLRHNHKHWGRVPPNSMEWHMCAKAARTLRCWLFCEIAKLERLALWGDNPFPVGASQMRQTAIRSVPRRVCEAYFATNTDCLPPTIM
jgi:hypothetical protein